MAYRLISYNNVFLIWSLARVTRQTYHEPFLLIKLSLFKYPMQGGHVTENILSQANPYMSLAGYAKPFD